MAEILINPERIAKYLVDFRWGSGNAIKYPVEVSERTGSDRTR
jgi:hypothetical protein